MRGSRYRQKYQENTGKQKDYRTERNREKYIINDREKDRNTARGKQTIWRRTERPSKTEWDTVRGASKKLAFLVAEPIRSPPPRA